VKALYKQRIADIEDALYKWLYWLWPTLLSTSVCVCFPLENAVIIFFGVYKIHFWNHVNTIFSRSYTVWWSSIGIILLSVCPSVCDAVHCGDEGRSSGLKVVPSCFSDGASYLLLQTLLLKDVSFSHNTHRKPNRRDFRVWSSHRQRGHATVAIPDAAFSAVLFCIVYSTIGLVSNSHTLLVGVVISGELRNVIGLLHTGLFFQLIFHHFY